LTDETLPILSIALTLDEKTFFLSSRTLDGTLSTDVRPFLGVSGTPSLKIDLGLEPLEEGGTVIIGTDGWVIQVL
jgi:hypothetical protein